MKKLLAIVFLFLSIQSYAQLDASVVVFYLQNLPYERIGSESDQDIIADLENKGYRVIPVDCVAYPRTSPQLEEALMIFHKNSPTLLSAYYTSAQIKELDVFYVPEGYTLKKHIPVWNMITHGAEGSLQKIMDSYNKDIVTDRTKYGRTAVTDPNDMIDKKGNPLDYNMYMHIVYPSGNASEKVPVVINFASSSQMQKGFNPVKPKESTIYRSIFPLGFLTTGYAWAHVDHPYNPLARDHVYEYFDNYTLENWNGLNLARAYVRYLRTHAAELNLNGKIGAMGISKASYSTVRIANLNNAEEEEHSLFNNTPNTKLQPYPGVPSTIDVAYAAAGLGTMRIAAYANSNTVPMATSAGLTDEYNQWNLYPPVVKHFQTNKLNHLPMWLEDLGHDYPCMGTDIATGENRYQLLKRYFDNYLKPASASDPLEVFYIFPHENSTDINSKGYSRILTSDDILPSNMQGVSPYAPITVRFLSGINISEIISKVKVLHKATHTEVIGTWSEAVDNMVFEFIPDGYLQRSSEYEIVVSAGLQAKNGQVLPAETKRSFIVQTLIDVKKRVFFDDFERTNLSPGGTPELTYTSSTYKESGTNIPAASIVSTTKVLQLTNGGGGGKTGHGRVFLHGELSKYDPLFNSKLSEIEADSVVWSFNFRHTANNPYFVENSSGFGHQQNGFATVLVADGSDITTASGYAIVAGDITYGKRHRLVRFENGLNDNSKLVNVASGANEMATATGGADYHGVKVVYIPKTNMWRLYFKTKEQGDVADIAIPMVSQGTDNTLTGSVMTHFGFLNNYNTTTVADRMVFWDNYSVKLFHKENVQPVLDDITVDSETIEHYDKEKFSYTYYLPYTYAVSEIPQVNYVQNDSKQQVEVTPASDLTGNSTERTTVIKVTEGALVSEYRIEFKILPKMDIYLCLGQSNMNGYGEIMNEDKGFIDNTYLLTPGKRFENAENPLNKYSTISNNGSGISPSYGFAKALIGKTENPVGLLVNARNGSSIKYWGKANENSTDLYANTLARAKEAQKWGVIKAIIWHQGESDSWQYQNYPGLITSWVNDFRTDIGDTNNEILFVAGELAYWRSSGTSQPFNNLLHGISSYIPNSDWVSADGLTPWKDETDPHFDRQSAITLGERYAEKVIEKTLPVKLTSFTAKVQRNIIKLNWSTVSEKNSSHFDILRSSDGQNFLKIGEIKAGNTASKTDYSFNDSNPFPGINYYKLQQFDKDGKSEFFGPVQVTMGIEKIGFNIYASKIENMLKAGFYSPVKQSGRIKVLDMNGRALIEQGLNFDKGYNQISLPVNNLKQGVQVAILDTQGEVIAKKFVW